MKKILSLFLVLVLVLSLAGCGGDKGGANKGGGGLTAADHDPETKYDISYTGYWCFSDYEDDSYIESMIEDALNIEITVEKAETADSIDLLLAAGEMPDCMWSDKTVGWMYEQELVRPIPKDLVKEHCPDLIAVYDKYPLLYEQSLNPDNPEEFLSLRGVTFQFVNYYLPNDYYRYDWIENLGIDLGVNVEEVADRIYVADNGIELSKFEEIMDAFVNKDPNGTGKRDTVGATAQNFDQGPFYSAFGFHREINEVDGKAVQAYAMDKYKEYLKGFAKLYEKGLLDPEIVAGDRTLSWDKVNKGVAGYWMTSTNALNTWAVDRPPLTLLAANPDAKILLTPGIRPDGGEVQGHTNPSPAYGNFYVNANVDDAKLVRILQFVNFSLFGNGDKDIHASTFFGEKGVDWDWDETGEMPIKINTLNSGDKGTWTFSQFGQDEDVTRWTGEEPMFAAGGKYWSASEDGIWMKWQVPSYKEDIANVTNYEKIEQRISGDLNAYVANFRTQAIRGQIDVDASWDKYLAELKRMGYNEMMEELEKIDSIEDIIASYNK